MALLRRSNSPVLPGHRQAGLDRWWPASMARGRWALCSCSRMPVLGLAESAAYRTVI